MTHPKATGHIWDLMDYLDALDGKTINVSVQRHDWGTTQRVGGPPASGGIDLDDLADRVSARMARNLNRQGMD